MEVYDSINSKNLKLKSYRYPAYYDSTKGEFKGVIFFMHGFSDYSARFAHVAQKFS